MTTTILITGPPMTQKEALAQQVIDGLESPPTTFELSTTGDRVYEESEIQKITDASNIRPTDLTGIGIRTAEWLTDKEAPLLLILNDLNTLQMYHEKDTLFKFLHILTSKLKADGTTFICIQTIIDEDEPNPLVSLFDYVLTTEQSSDGAPAYETQQNTASEDLPIDTEN